MCFSWGYYFKTYLENIINISLSDYNTMKMSFRKLILLEMSFKCIFSNKTANKQCPAPPPPTSPPVLNCQQRPGGACR